MGWAVVGVGSRHPVRVFVHITYLLLEVAASCPSHTPSSPHSSLRCLCTCRHLHFSQQVTTHVRVLRVCVPRCFSRDRGFATPWTIAHQAPLSTGSSRQGPWSGLPFPPPGDLPGPEIEPTSLALAGGLFIPEPPGKSQMYFSICLRSIHLFFYRRR